MYSMKWIFEKKSATMISLFPFLWHFFVKHQLLSLELILLYKILLRDVIKERRISPYSSFVSSQIFGAIRLCAALNLTKHHPSWTSTEVEMISPTYSCRGTVSQPTMISNVPLPVWKITRLSTGDLRCNMMIVCRMEMGIVAMISAIPSPTWRNPFFTSLSWCLRMVRPSLAARSRRTPWFTPSKKKLVILATVLVTSL